MAAAIHAYQPARCLRKIIPNKGVRTTNIPVINPAFDAEVYLRPTVWKM
jgi:hypothetical protein